MAETKPECKHGAVGKCVRDLENEITCSICHEQYTDPRFLPCCHYFCRRCIRNLSQRADENKPFPCPECRKDITLPESKVDDLQPAFFINRIKEIHSRLKFASTKLGDTEPNECEFCNEFIGNKKVKAYCQQCGRYLCVKCARSHKKKGRRSGHFVHFLDGGDNLTESSVVKRTSQKPPTQEPRDHKHMPVVVCHHVHHVIFCTCKDTVRPRQEQNGHEVFGIIFTVLLVLVIAWLFLKLL